VTILQRLVGVGATLAALLFALDLFSATVEDTLPAKPRIALSATDWPNVMPDSPHTMRWHVREASPAVRIREAFAQFMPGEGKARPRATPL
jgi:hypothetical protein